MKISRLDFLNKEKITVKRMLLVVATTLMFLNTLVVTTVAHADGVGGVNCPNACKP